MSHFALYTLIKLDEVKVAVWVLFSLCLVIPLLCTVITWGKEKVGEEKYFKSVFDKTRWMLYLSVFFFVAGILIPSTKQMAIVYVVPKVINNKMVGEIPAQLLKLSYEWLEELRPENVLKEKVEDITTEGEQGE